MQGGEGKSNIVLFHKAARVQPLDVPNGAEISASLYDETEDGPEIRYWVSEEVPPAGSPANSQPSDFLLRSESLDSPVDNDDRQFTLRLNASSVAVHHVNGIVYSAESHRVSRHRFEKREPKF